MPESLRIYAVGDVHGRHDLLMRLLGRIMDDAGSREDDREVRVVFLGDYIDRGDHSKAVLESLSQLWSPEDKGRIGFLRGNHEVAMKAFLEDPVRGKAWIEFGGRQTLASFGIRMSAERLGRRDLQILGEELASAISPYKAFLDDLRPVLSSGDVIFTHAGFEPGRALEDQREEVLYWGDPEGPADRPAPGKLVVHGHYDAPRPVIRPGRICIDTGAYYSGVLSALCLDDDISVIDSAGRQARTRIDTG